MQHEDHEVLGKVAYQTYGEAVGGRNVRGHPLPGWEDLGDVVQTGWMRSAGVIAATALQAAADLIDKGPTFPLPPSVISELIRECAGGQVCRKLVLGDGR